MPRRISRNASLAILCLALFAWLMVEVKAGRTLSFDVQIRDQIHRIASRPLTTGFLVLTQFGSSFWILPCAALMVLMLRKQSRPNQAVILIAVLAGAYLLEHGLKVAIGRVRPEPFFGLKSPTSFSFPSGHALFSTSFYGTLASLSARIAPSRRQKATTWLAAALCIALICLSRVYLGVHYPTDVMGGVLIACFWINTILAFVKSPSS